MFRRSSLVIAGALAAAALSSASAQAAERICVPTAASRPTLTPDAAGNCLAGYRTATVITNSEYSSLNQRLAALERLLAGASRTTNVGGQDTLTLSGMNLQVTNGAGATSTSNGKGNVVVGYNENGSVTGSHNVVAGTGNSASSFGSVVGGVSNRASGAYSASFGWKNTAAGPYSFVGGGLNNLAESGGASVGGGCGNVAGNATATKLSDAVLSECVNGSILYAPSVAGGAMNRSLGLGRRSWVARRTRRRATSRWRRAARAIRRRARGRRCRRAAATWRRAGSRRSARVW